MALKVAATENDCNKAGKVTGPEPEPDHEKGIIRVFFLKNESSVRTCAVVGGTVCYPSSIKR